MHSSTVVFGERVVLLGGAPSALPGRVLLPGNSPIPGSVRLLVPGRGDTMRDQAAASFDPEWRRRAEAAAGALGITPTRQDEVDLPAAERLCPPSPPELRFAAAVLDLGVWRYKATHTPPGARLAEILETRPTDLAPEPGSGVVIGAEADGVPGGAIPMDSAWPDTVLETIVARQRLISHLHAQQYADIAALSGCYPGIHQFLTTELALALRTTDADAAALIGDAEALRDRLPATQRALADGTIDDTQALALIRATTSTTAEVAAEVERKVLPHAGDLTATSLRRRAARIVIATDPDGAAQRHRRSRTDRFVSRHPEDDGMARMNVHGPAQDVAVIWEALTAVGDAIKKPGDGRALGARRVDALTMICRDILAGGGWSGLTLPDRGHGRPRVVVTVPYTVLFGHRAPCELHGHGPISTEQALSLIGNGDLYRMLCDPMSGQTLDYGHTRYRPPPHLAEFVRMRDGECPMPSCHHPAVRGHLDHIVPARPDPVTGRPTHGTTSADNLTTPCPHHHLAKDAGRGFSLHRAADGTYTWTTPLRRRYTWRPDPHWSNDTDEAPASHDDRHIRDSGWDTERGPSRNPSLDPDCDTERDAGGHARPDTAREADGAVSVCGCNIGCPCQYGPPPGSFDRLEPVLAHGDPDDHMPPERGEPSGRNDPAGDPRPPQDDANDDRIAAGDGTAVARGPIGHAGPMRLPSNGDDVRARPWIHVEDRRAAPDWARPADPPPF